MEIINWVTALDWTGIINIALQAVGLAALVSAATPNTADDKIVDMLLKGLNFLGANFNKATNK